MTWPVEAGEIPALQVDYDPALFASMLRSNHQSECIRWWRAHLDPTYDRRAGVAADGGRKWLHVEQNTGDYVAGITGTETQTKFTPQGSWPAGSIMVTTMPDELPIGPEDWICPMGRSGSGAGETLDARAVLHKDLMIRGGTDVPMVGTISASGSSVTGSATTFTTALQVGDIVKAAGTSLRVSAIGDNTHLTLESAAPAWSGIEWARCDDVAARAPMALIEYIADAAGAYTVGVNVATSADGMRVQWLSATASPAPGVRYSIIYRYFPRYVVLPDGVAQRRVVNGRAMPQRVIARLLFQDMEQ
jgi:hypothetical protein